MRKLVSLRDGLVIPDGIHTKAGFGDPHPCHAAKMLVLPAVNLQPALLVVGDGDPLITPIARRDGVAVAAARRGGVETDLLLDGAAVAQAEGGDVALQVEAVGAGRGEQIAAGARQGAHVAAVHGVVAGDAGRNQGVAVVRVNGQVRVRVDDVLAQPVARLHQGVQVLARRVHGHPARVIARRGRVDGPHERQLAAVAAVLAVHPQLVGLEVGRVQPRLGRIEDHAVDARVGLVLVVLDVLGQGAARRGGENGTVAGVLVEGVAVDGIRWLLGGQEEDGAGVGFCRCGLGCEGC